MSSELPFGSAAIFAHRMHSITMLALSKSIILSARHATAEQTASALARAGGATKQQRRKQEQGPELHPRESLAAAGAQQQKPPHWQHQCRHQ
jgi:hypothetical protein